MIETEHSAESNWSNRTARLRGKVGVPSGANGAPVLDPSNTSARYPSGIAAADRSDHESALDVHDLTGSNGPLLKGRSVQARALKRDACNGCHHQHQFITTGAKRSTGCTRSRAANA